MVGSSEFFFYVSGALKNDIGVGEGDLGISVRPKASSEGEKSEFFQVPELIWDYVGGGGGAARNFSKSQSFYRGG